MGEARVQTARPRQILDAARTCFGRHGFHGASMARIAAEAQISVGHIYRYFESKEAVVAAIVEADLSQAVEVLGAIDGEPEDLAARLLDVFLTSYTADKTALWLEIMSEAARNPPVRAIMCQAEARIRAHMRLSLVRSRHGSTDVCPSAMDVRIDTVLALLEGVNLRRFKHDGDVTPAFLREVHATLATTLMAPLQTLSASAPEQGDREIQARVGHRDDAEQKRADHGAEAHD